MYILISRDVQRVPSSRLIPFDGTCFVLFDDPKWRWNANYRPSTIKSCQFYELKYREKFVCFLKQEWQKINEKCSSPEFELMQIIQITDTQSKREIKPIFLL